MSVPERLETERLIMRRASVDGADAIFDAYAADPEVTRYLSWRPHENVEELPRDCLCYSPVRPPGPDEGSAQRR